MRKLSEYYNEIIFQLILKNIGTIKKLTSNCNDC